MLPRVQILLIPARMCFDLFGLHVVFPALCPPSSVFRAVLRPWCKFVGVDVIQEFQPMRFQNNLSLCGLSVLEARERLDSSAVTL